LISRFDVALTATAGQGQVAEGRCLPAGHTIRALRAAAGWDRHLTPFDFPRAFST
jgi:hypothetical protein